MEDGSGGQGRGFSLYLSIRGLRKGPGKFLMGVLESLGKVLDFFVSNRVGTLLLACWFYCWWIHYWLQA